MSKAPWRVGRSLGRTLYQRVYTDHASKDDHFVGIMDSRELAQQVVDAVNAARESAQAIKVTDPGNLSGSLVADLQVELADILGVKPEGHSLTGDYAALKGDAERLARVRAEHVARLEEALAHATRFVYGNGRAQIAVDYEPGWGHENVPWVVRSPRPVERHPDRATALARAHELAQEEA